MKLQIRTCPKTGKESVHLEGYVNAVERESRLLPPSMAPAGKTEEPFYEVVKTGAFASSLQQRPNVGLMLNHRDYIGSVGAGDIILQEDAIGLHAEADVTAEPVVLAAKQGKLRGWSFGFADETDTWETGADGVPRRYLSAFDLREVSVLTETPAYIATTVSVRDDATDTVTVQYREYIEPVENAEPNEEKVIAEVDMDAADNITITTTTETITTHKCVIETLTLGGF